MNNGYFYFASPYSKRPDLETAFDAACRVAVRLMSDGWPIYSPIVHMHPIAKYIYHDPRDSSFWVNLCAPMMIGAKGLIVAKLPGWEDSAGIAAEIAYFRGAKKEILYVSGDPLMPIFAMLEREG